MNTFKNFFGVIAFIGSLLLLIIAVISLVILIDNSIATISHSDFHIIKSTFPNLDSGCEYAGPGIDCFGSFRENILYGGVPKYMLTLIIIITSLISFSFYRLGKKWRRDNEVISEN